MANSMHWYDHELRREDGHVLRGALGFEVEGQRKKWRPKSTCKMHVQYKGMMVGLCREGVH